MNYDESMFVPPWHEWSNDFINAEKWDQFNDVRILFIFCNQYISIHLKGEFYGGYRLEFNHLEICVVTLIKYKLCISLRYLRFVKILPSDRQTVVSKAIYQKF